MKSSEMVAHVYEKAKELLDEREPEYGHSWEEQGLDICLPQVFRKANYLKVQYNNGRAHNSKFKEDLLDCLNWCAFAYRHLELIDEKGK